MCPGGRTFPASPPRMRSPFSPGGAAPSASRRAAPAGASCTSRGPPWSCQTTTRRARPAMSTRRSRPSPSSTPGSEAHGIPRPPAPSRKLLAALGFLRQDQPCLTAFRPAILYPTSDLTTAPRFLYIHTRNTPIKQSLLIASIFHIFLERPFSNSSR